VLSFTASESAAPGEPCTISGGGTFPPFSESRAESGKDMGWLQRREPTGDSSVSGMLGSEGNEGGVSSKSTSILTASRQRSADVKLFSLRM
jgi:hypothetical protein